MKYKRTYCGNDQAKKYAAIQIAQTLRTVVEKSPSTAERGFRSEVKTFTRWNKTPSHSPLTLDAQHTFHLFTGANQTMTIDYYRCC
jgi:hypothetical protein